MTTLARTFADDYRALTEEAGVVDLAPLRARVEIRGDDRRSFLHNFCTNEIKKLADGSGCEAFLLDAKGHVLFYDFVWCGPESLLLDGASGTGSATIKHLDRYLIREKVTLHDRTVEWGELLVAGPRAEALLRETLQVEPPQTPLSSVSLAVVADSFLGRSMFTPDPNFVIVGPSAAVAEARDRLLAAGARGCGTAAFDTLRIEAGLPLGGIDVDDKNLPQEVDRNELILNFRKGCYLGQETVARLDALGHVNKTLVRLKFTTATPDAIPPTGTPLSIGSQQVGHVTSAAYSPRRGGVIGLGYVKRGSNSVGTQLESIAGTVDIAGR